MRVHRQRVLERVLEVHRRDFGSEFQGEQLDRKKTSGPLECPQLFVRRCASRNSPLGALHTQKLPIMFISYSRDACRNVTILIRCGCAKLGFAVSSSLPVMWTERTNVKRGTLRVELFPALLVDFHDREHITFQLHSHLKEHPGVASERSDNPAFSSPGIFFGSSWANPMTFPCPTWLATRQIQIRSFMMVFFALIIMPRDRKPILVSHLYIAHVHELLW